MMKSSTKSTIIVVSCSGLYLLINNTLKYNNAPRWTHIFSWIPMVIYVVYEFKLVFKELTNDKD